MNAATKRQMNRRDVLTLIRDVQAQAFEALIEAEQGNDAKARTYLTLAQDRIRLLQEREWTR